VDHLLKEFVFDLHLKKLRSITIFLHSKILKNVLNKKLLDHILSLSTSFVSSDVDLLWSKDGSDVYFKLSDFSNSLQVYAKANHVDDVANVKPFYLQML
jgi:hypothetical protein